MLQQITQSCALHPHWAQEIAPGTMLHVERTGHEEYRVSVKKHDDVRMWLDIVDSADMIPAGFAPEWCYLRLIQKLEQIRSIGKRAKSSLVEKSVRDMLETFETAACGPGTYVHSLNARESLKTALWTYQTVENPTATKKTRRI